jgi:uncharacterized protein
MEHIQKYGFDFSFDPSACNTCQGRCCRGTSGHVWISQQEIKQMGLFLKTNPIDVIDRYLHRIDNRYAIKEQYDAGGFACIFFNKLNFKCSIYEARPSQCRQFPFWAHFKQHRKLLINECPGVRMHK